MENFIRHYDGAVSIALCADIIAGFEADPGRFQGMVSGNEGAELIAGKRTTELMLVTDEWQDVV